MFDGLQNIFLYSPLVILITKVQKMVQEKKILN